MFLRTSPLRTCIGLTASLTASARESFIGVGPQAPMAIQLQRMEEEGQRRRDELERKHKDEETHSSYAVSLSSVATISLKSGRPLRNTTVEPCSTFPFVEAGGEEGVDEGSSFFSESAGGESRRSSVTNPSRTGASLA